MLDSGLRFPGLIPGQVIALWFVLLLSTSRSRHNHKKLMNYLGGRVNGLQWTSIPSSGSNTKHIPSYFNYDTETIVRILAYFATKKY